MAIYLITSLMVIFLFALYPSAAYAAWSSVAHSSALLTFGQFNEDNRVTRLKEALERYNSPLAKEAKNFIFYADKFQLDWKLVAAIAGAESTFGKHIPSNSFNAWGWAVYTGRQTGAVFTSWEEGIAVVSRGLREGYLNEGLTTPEQIGRRYAASHAWPKSVRFFIGKITDFSPSSTRTIPVEL